MMIANMWRLMNQAKFKPIEYETMMQILLKKIDPFLIFSYEISITLMDSL